jgi:hypothetical protein
MKTASTDSIQGMGLWDAGILSLGFCYRDVVVDIFYDYITQQKY